jgi:hemerythrin superfamily protein
MTRVWKNDAMKLAGMFAVGMIGGRLLAPLIASANGAVRTKMGADPFERLIQDHRQILSVLHDMENTETDSRAKRAAMLLRVKRMLGKHAMAEEDVVYPLLHDRAHAETETRQLYDEHADIKIHLYELEQMVRNNEDWRHRVMSLRRLIETHARQEEEQEFPKLRQALQERERVMVAGQIRREEALVV